MDNKDQAGKRCPKCQSQPSTDQRHLDRFSPNHDYDYLFKIVATGDAKVGKSSLLRRFADDQFDERHLKTVGVDFRVKTVELDRSRIKLQVWDTAGQERFFAITSAFYRGSHGVVFVYDITDQDSFNHVRRWAASVERYSMGSESSYKLLVGNKCDLTTKRVIDYATGKALADQLGLDFMETSAKTSTNVEQAFMTMTAKMKERQGDLPQTCDHSKICLCDSKPVSTGNCYTCYM